MNKYWNRIITIKESDGNYIQTYIRASSFWEAVELIAQERYKRNQLWEVVGINEPKEESDF